MNRETPWTDGTKCPFGKYKGKLMCFVVNSYFDWFFRECQNSPFFDQMLAYWKARQNGTASGKNLTGGNGENGVKKNSSPLPPRPPVKSDPAKAAAAFEEFKKLKGNL